MGRLPTLLPIALLLTTQSFAQDLSEATCDVSNVPLVVEPGATAVISALIGFSTAGQGEFGCGAPDTSRIPAYEALLWALNLINQDSGTINGQAVTDSYIPGIKLGLRVHDTCGRTQVASAATAATISSLATSADSCSQSTDTLTLGVLSDSPNNVSSALASFLGEFHIPQISYSATSPELSDVNTFPTFLRTIPSENLQIQVILEALSALGWTQITVVYSNDDYGNAAYDVMRNSATNLGICVSYARRVGLDLDLDGYQDVLEKLVDNEVTAVVYLGGFAQARGLMEAGDSVTGAGTLQWIFPARIGTSLALVENLPYARGAITITPASRHIPEFEDHWVRIDDNAPSNDNPWYKSWYMEVHQCHLSGVTEEPYASYPACTTQSVSEKRASYAQDPYVEPAITAIFTFARALRDAQEVRCGTSSSGICNDLLTLLSEEFVNEYLKKASFTFINEERISSLSSSSIEPFNSAKRVAFDENGDLVEPSFDIWNYNDLSGSYKFEKVGTYIDGQLTLNADDVQFYDDSRSVRLNYIPLSECPSSGCDICISSTTSGTQHAFVSGDVIIGAILSVHKEGSQPLSCGFVDAEGDAQLTEAFLFALDQVAALPNILPDVQLGGLILDDCASAGRAVSTLTDFISGTIVHEDNGEEILPSSVYAVIGGNSDDVTKSLADVTNGIKMPFLPYKSGSTVLSMENHYNYISKMVSSDSQLAAAVASAAVRLGWKHVQLVYDGDAIGQAFLEDLFSQSTKFDLCVSSRLSIRDYGRIDDLAGEVMASEVKAVVVRLNPDDASSLLRSMSGFGNAGDFAVIAAGGSWSSDSVISDLIPSLPMPLLFLEVPSPQLTSYTNYLQNLEPGTPSRNPWFTEWYQTMFECYLDARERSGYTQQCTGNDPVTAAQNFHQHPYAVYVINAVYAIAYGLDATLKEICGDGYQGLCADFHNVEDIARDLTNKIQAAMFTDVVGNPFSFIGDSGSTGFEIKFYANGQMNSVGTYTVTTGFLNLDPTQLLAFTSVTSQCPSPCAACNYMYPLQPHFVVDGDIMLGMLVDIHLEGDDPFTCGDLKFGRGFLFTEALRYALDRVNTGAAPVSVNGIQLGALALDSCTSATRASNQISGVYSGSLTFSNVNTNDIAGWITAGETLSTEINDVIAEIGTTHISAYTTGPSTDGMFQTVSSGETLSLGIVNLMTYMGWKYAQVIRSPNYYGWKLEEIFKTQTSDAGNCVTSSFALDTDGTASEIASNVLLSQTTVIVIFATRDYLNDFITELDKMGTAAQNLILIVSHPWSELLHPTNLNDAIVFDINSPSLLAFEQYLGQVSEDQSRMAQNPWFVEFIEEAFQCDIGPEIRFNVLCYDLPSRPLTTGSLYRQDNTVQTTINAVYAYAGALDLALKEVCGENYDAICDDFVPLSAASVISEKLAQVTFTDDSGTSFEFTNGANELGFMLRRLESGAFLPLGSFAGSSLQIGDVDAKSHYESYTVSCDPQACQRCTDNTWQERVNYVHGDILIGGLFDIHLPGTTPFTCGSIDDHQAVQLVEAFNFALSYVNNHEGPFSGILQGLTLGGVALDSCESVTRSTNLLANVHSGQLRLQVDDTEIDADRIDVYVTGTPDDVTASTSEMLTLLGIPMVSFKSPNAIFDDENMYPFFLRTVPSDVKQAHALIELLSLFTVDYIQVVSSGDVFGNQTARDFIELATSRSICVAQHIILDNNLEMGPARTEVAKLLLAPLATTVVTLINGPDVNTFLSAVQTNDELSDFKFLGSTSWADSDAAIAGLGSNILGAVTLGLHRRDVPGLNEYMLDLTPAVYTSNPWFNEYYESVRGCSLNPDSDVYDEQCADDSVPLVQADGYTQDILVPYVINAVHAAAMGIHHALQELCGDIYFGVCEEFRNNAARRPLILRGMESANFADVIGQPFQFTNSGDGATGYQVFTVAQATASSALYYENIGSYSDSTSLVLPPYFDPGWSSSCSIDGACEECTIEEGPVRSRVLQKPSPEDLNLVLFINAHHQSVDDALLCGELDITGGFQHALAFLYATELVNSNPGLLLSPTIKLGGAVIDTCSSSVRVTQDVFSLTVGNSLYDVPSGELIDSDTILAFMPYGSENAQAASNLLSPRGVLTMSPSASSDDLTGTPYFLRTVQAYTKQAKALAELVSSFNWGYISVVFSDDAEGKSFKDAFMNESAMTNVRSPLCIGGVVAMPPGAGRSGALEVVPKLDGVRGANIVVVLTSKEDTRSLLEAANEAKYYERFIWVGGTAWGRDMEVVEGLEEVARGSLSIHWWNEPVSGFIDYVSSMTLADHGAIPDDWFEEFWQRMLECRLDNSSVPLTQFASSCHGNMRLSPEMIVQDEYVLQTIIATFMVAQGLNDLDDCDGNQLGISKCLSQLPDRNAVLYQAIRNAQWPILDGELSEEVLFMFDDHGNGNTGYNVYNYRTEETDEMEYVKIGSRLSSLEVDHSLYYSYDYDGNALRSYPISQCPDSACVCLNHDIASVAMATAASGLDPLEYFYEIWGIIIIALTCVGLVSSIVALVYLFIYYPNRQGTTVLGYLLVFGVICMYALIFAFILHDSVEICGIRRFGLSFVYAICFSCLLIKVMNNWRVGAYEEEFSHPTYERLSHPVSILFIAIFLILVQVIISIEWLILVPPDIETVYQNGRFMPVCSPQDFHTEELIISCIYPMMLILLTLVFASVTWDSQENHRESRWVLFTCVVTIGIWLIWTIVAAITEIEFQEPAVAVALLVNATIILVALAVRKIVLLVKYQKQMEENKSGFSGSAMQDFLKDQELFGTLRSTGHRDDDDVFVATSLRPQNGDLYGSIHINPPDYFGTSRSARSHPRPRPDDIFGTTRSTPGRARTLHTPRRAGSERGYNYGHSNKAFEYDDPPSGAHVTENGIMYIYGPDDTGIKDEDLTQF